MPETSPDRRARDSLRYTKRLVLAEIHLEPYYDYLPLPTLFDYVSRTEEQINAAVASLVEDGLVELRGTDVHLTALSIARERERKAKEDARRKKK